MKKLLIVTYYWPPAGGPGVQRWLKFVKYLRDFDFEPIVYVPENPHYPLLDKSLEFEIPEGIKVIRKPIFEPYSLAKLFSGKETQTISSGIIAEGDKQSFLQKMMLFIRGNFFIPDARKFWIKPSVKFLTEYLKENSITQIITTGPPHSLHLIGLGVKKEIEIKWVADFRDPWTGIGYHKKLKLTQNSRQKHEELEKEVLNAADHIISTSFTTKKAFQELTNKPITVITNGYDKIDFPKPVLDEKFSISHIGSLLSGRNPENLWKALANLISKNEDFASDFILKLIGAVGEQVLNSIKKAGLENHVSAQKYVPHSKALQLQRSSQLLLLIEIDSEETKEIIPGKLFEYMQSQRPILAVGPENSDIQKIISETNTGKFFNYSEKVEIEAFILKAYTEFKTEGLRSYPIGLQKYSRKALTGELVKILQHI